jgi:acetylglutamate kinase
MKSIVIKIGGSTLGNHDTTLEDLVTLQKVGVPMVVIHGGGKLITEWLTRLNMSTTFVRGLRVTDLETLEVVTAVLAGLVNKELVSQIYRLGGNAIGLSGADGNIVSARNRTPELGYTGEELTIDINIISMVLNARYIPVIAPICLAARDTEKNIANLMNVNGDSVAAEIAVALSAEKLVFLTDVPGIYDQAKNIIPRLSHNDIVDIINSGVASGGMLAKIEACLSAVKKVPVTRIIDGRRPHALYNEIDGKGEGTTIGW